MAATSVFGAVVVLFFGIPSFGLAEDSTLLNVVQIYRHGERTPTGFYANDPYQDISYWGIDVGQLTNVGKRQHYELGQYTRRRYTGFLPLRYDRADFYVQCTEIDRTHMSASSQVAGLFPPQADQVWHKDINWQPIPIFPSDTPVMSTLSTCTRYTNEMLNVIATDEYFLNLNEQYAELYEYLTNHSGTSVTSIAGAYAIYDALYIEDRQNFVLPEWTKSVYPEPLKTLDNIMFSAFSFNDELKLLSTGPFFNYLVEKFDDYIEDSTSSQKYVQFSAHDANVASILNTLGAWDQLAPNFASTIYIELRERNGTNFINIFYKNYGDADPVDIPGCGIDCDWDQFKTLISNRTLTSDEWYVLCDS